MRRVDNGSFVIQALPLLIAVFTNIFLNDTGSGFLHSILVIGVSVGAGLASHYLLKRVFGGRS